YLKVIDQSGESPDLSKLQLLTSALTPLPLEQEKPDKAISKSHGSGTLLPLTSKMEPRQRTVSAYLFRIAGEIFSNGPVNRVHWLRAKAQFERWKEEQDSIHNEVVWVPAYFHTMAELWKAQVEFSVQGDLSRHAAYAPHQAYAWEELSLSATKALALITSASLKHI